MLAPVIIALGAVVLAIVDHLLKASGWPTGIVGALEELAKAIVKWLTELSLEEEEATGLADQKRLALTAAHETGDPVEVSTTRHAVTDVNARLHAGVKARARAHFRDPAFAREHNLQPGQVTALVNLPDEQLDEWIRETVTAYNARRAQEQRTPAVIRVLRRVRPALFADDAAEARLRAAIPGTTIPEPAADSKG